MILLDTNAVVWLEQRHARVRSLARGHRRLHLSPATLLELQFLEEAGRIRIDGGVAAIAADERWILDEPPAAKWFETSLSLSWTRDPFDRLITAHAELRGWRLATGDQLLIQRLGSKRTIAV